MDELQKQVLAEKGFFAISCGKIGLEYPFKDIS